MPRAMSLVEAISNVVVGYGVAVIVQILIFPVSACKQRWHRT